MPFTAIAAPVTARADLVDTAVATGSFKTLAAALKAAEDAIILDTTFMKANEVFEEIIKRIEQVL